MIELVKAVERSGIPSSEFLRAANIEPAWLETDDHRLRREQVFALAQVALDLTRDPAFGLHWGEWLTANSFNLISHLLVHASSLSQAFQTFGRFGQLMADDASVELVEFEDRAELRLIDTTEQPLAMRRLIAEMSTLGFSRLIQHFGGRSGKVASVSFQYPAPAYRSEYTRLFEGTERFDQPFTGLSFSRALLHARSPQIDEGLYGTLTDLAERRLLRLQTRAPYALQVRHHLMQQRMPHRVSMRQIAARIGISVRSLHRRLHEEGQSYVALANAAAADLAKRLLQDERQTIQETAHTLGFSSVSSFHRAFRRWTGTTPAAVREQIADPYPQRTG